jgi:hypothetical protein
MPRVDHRLVTLHCPEMVHRALTAEKKEFAPLPGNGVGARNLFAMDVVDAAVDYITTLQLQIGIRYERDAVRYFVRNLSAYSRASGEVQRRIEKRAVHRFERFKKTFARAIALLINSTAFFSTK